MAPQIHLYISPNNKYIGFILYQETHTIIKNEVKRKKRLRIQFIKWNIIDNTFVVYLIDNLNCKWFLNDITTLRLNHCRLNSNCTQFVCSVADYSSSLRTNNFDEEHKSYILDIDNETNTITVNNIINLPSSYDIPPFYCRKKIEESEEKLICLYYSFLVRILEENYIVLNSNLVCSSSTPVRSGCTNMLTISTNNNDSNNNDSNNIIKVRLEKSKVIFLNSDETALNEIDLSNI